MKYEKWSKCPRAHFIYKASRKVSFPSLVAVKNCRGADENRTTIVTSLKLAETGTFFGIFFIFFILLFVYIQTIEMYALKHKMIAENRKKGSIWPTYTKKKTAKTTIQQISNLSNKTQKFHFLTIAGLSGGWLLSILLF